MALAIPRYTVDDLANFPDDGNRYELLDGVLLVTPAPGMSHQLVATRLLVQLATALGAHAHVLGPGAVVRRPRTQLEPDVLVIPSRFPPTTDEWWKVDEHWLAIEVFSRSSRVYDRDFKANAYLALGVRDVWLVDRQARSVELRSAAGQPRVAADTIRWRPPGLDMVVPIDVTEIFAGFD